MTNNRIFSSGELKAIMNTLPACMCACMNAIDDDDDLAGSETHTGTGSNRSAGAGTKAYKSAKSSPYTNAGSTPCPDANSNPYERIIREADICGGTFLYHTKTDSDASGNMNARRTLAIFEGIMDSQIRKMKAGKPRLYFRRYINDREQFLRMVIKNKNRTVMVYVYDGNIDISTFLVDKQGGCYDYISCGTPEAPTDEDVFCLLDILEDIFFPLLEKPCKELKEVFPDLWH